MSTSYVGVEDLLSDESFLSWWFKTDERSVARWEAMIAADAELYGRVRQAVSFLESLPAGERSVGEAQITAAERRLLDAIRRAEAGLEGRQGMGLARGMWVWSGQAGIMAVRKSWWAAAVFVIAIAGGYWLVREVRGRSSVKTEYGEVRGHLLPDGSEVVVNANSHIRYKDREVWLTGEAFFNVHKTPSRSQFIVHTAHFDIVVLGTSFNVVCRKGEDNVMLREGSIRLHTEEGKDLYMRPGDFVAYHPDKLEKKVLKADSITAWKDHKLVFNNTPLKEVAAIIEEHYGVKVTLGDPVTAGKTVYGIMGNDNLEVLLAALQATQDFEILRDENGITIHSKL